VFDCVKATLRHSGARGPFQGLSATLLRNAPANSIYLGSFEVMKQRAAEHYGCDTKDLSAGVVLAAGGTGGILYWLAIFPGARLRTVAACRLKRSGSGQAMTSRAWLPRRSQQRWLL
jgi:hypothetical protein